MSLDSATPPYFGKLWTPDEVAFATNELHKEFPVLAREKVVAAVHSAVPFVPLAQGRVKLLQKARELLRKN